MALLVGLSEKKIPYTNQIILYGAGAKLVNGKGLVAEFFKSGLVEFGYNYVDHI